MQNGDGIHDSALDNESVCATIPFRFPDELEIEDDLVPMAQVCSALSVILDWITVPSRINMTCARAHCLKTWLNPVEADFKSLNEIADVFDVSRASLSKSLLALRDEYKIHFGIGRLESSRERFRVAQLKSVANGRHVSQKRNIPIA